MSKVAAFCGSFITAKVGEQACCQTIAGDYLNYGQFIPRNTAQSLKRVSGEHVMIWRDVCNILLNKEECKTECTLLDSFTFF